MPRIFVQSTRSLTENDIETNSGKQEIPYSYTGLPSLSLPPNQTIVVLYLPSYFFRRKPLMVCAGCILLEEDIQLPDKVDVNSE